MLVELKWPKVRLHACVPVKLPGGLPGSHVLVSTDDIKLIPSQLLAWSALQPSKEIPSGWLKCMVNFAGHLLDMPTVGIFGEKIATPNIVHAMLNIRIHHICELKNVGTVIHVQQADNAAALCADIKARADMPVSDRTKWIGKVYTAVHKEIPEITEEVLAPAKEHI